MARDSIPSRHRARVFKDWLTVKRLLIPRSSLKPDPAALNGLRNDVVFPKILLTPLGPSAQNTEQIAKRLPV